MSKIMRMYEGGRYFDKKEYRKEVSRLAAIANKRMQRLEKNDLTDSPAYKKVTDNGEPRFGVKGKDFNQVQREYGRLIKFLNSQTSTIRGINKNLKEMAKNTGVKYKNMQELKKTTSKFFELASKVEQYLRTVEDMASAIGYQKIWEAINQYVKESKTDLSAASTNVDSLVEMVTQLIDADGGDKRFEDFDFTDGWVFID